jgi:hypothetical protein
MCRCAHCLLPGVTKAYSFKQDLVGVSCSLVHIQILKNQHIKSKEKTNFLLKKKIAKNSADVITFPAMIKKRINQ